MSEQRPVPLVHSFVVCREVLQDYRTGEYILLDPTDGFAVPQFPFPICFAVYGILTEVRGEIFPELRLDDSNTEMIWSYRVPEAVPCDDPLQQNRLRLHDVTIPIPRPGRYD